jgi:hypothetical protein
MFLPPEKPFYDLGDQKFFDAPAQTSDFTPANRRVATAKTFRFTRGKQAPDGTLPLFGEKNIWRLTKMRIFAQLSKVKDMKRLGKVAIYATVLFLSATEGIFAQPPPPEEIPVDGGAALLLGAGAAYGIKKYRDYRKKKNQ